VAAIGYFGFRPPTVQSTDDAYVRTDSVVISPKIAAYVEKLAVEENQRVRRGDVLAVLDDADYRLQVGELRATLQAKLGALSALQAERRMQDSAISQARAQMQVAQAHALHAEDDHARDRGLNSQGYATRDQLERSRTASTAAAAELRGTRAAADGAAQRIVLLDARRQQLESEIEQAQAALQTAQLQLDHASIRAPTDGVIANRSVQAGEYVRPGAPLFTLVPVDRAYVVANFKETQLARMHPGQSAEVQLDALPGIKLPARVQSVAPATGAEFALLPAQNATGNFTKIVQRVPVRLQLLASPEQLAQVRAGLSALVTVRLQDESSGANHVAIDERTPP
jgi:membrane fusion protein (multidrug efflux system)